ISARLVELMGGRIDVVSAPSRGSTFRFDALFGLGTGAAEAAAPRPEDLAGLSVLVVDDNATNRRILEEVLTAWRMRPTLVESGAAALAELERARGAGEVYGLILLDAMMPEMDGFTLAERMAAQPGLSGTTIMMLSSADRQQ